MKRFNILSIVMAFLLLAAWMPVNAQFRPKSSTVPKSKNVPAPAPKPKAVKPAVPQQPDAQVEEPQVDKKNMLKGLQNGNNQNKSKSLLDMIKEKNQSGELLVDKIDPVAELKLKAKDGDADAAYELGMYYYTGEEKDFKEAFKWFKKAHNGGNTQATLMMATCYYYGDGVEKVDHDKARTYYMIALQKGDESALELLNLLAEDDETFFLQLLSDIYRDGVVDDNGKTIVGVDLEKSLEYLKRIADKGDVDGQIAVGKFYLEQESLTKAQQQEALDYLDKAVSAGSLEAMLYMAEVYEKGKGGVKKDKTQAKKYTELAAQKGDEKSLMSVAMLYYNQNPATAESRKKAFRYFDMAANKGNLNALYFRGLMLYDGDGVDMDKDAAIGVLKEAAGKNHREAKAKLGEIYLADKDKNRQDQGLELIIDAAGNGSNQARWILANCYLTGAGTGNVVLRDYYKAAHWMSLVARGSHSAQYDGLIAELKEKKDPFYVYLKGLKEFSDENYKEAIKLFKEVKKSSKADGQTMEAACNMKMNNYKQAAAQLEEFIGEYKEKTVVEENGKKKEVYEKYKCYPAACYYLGTILLVGEDPVPKDEKQAMKLLETAAKEGIGVANCKLGNIYYDNDNQNKALDYYQQAEKQWAFAGYREVASRLALAYEDGSLKPIFKGDEKMDKYIISLRSIPEDYNPLKSMLDETEF